MQPITSVNRRGELVKSSRSPRVVAALACVVLLALAAPAAHAISYQTLFTATGAANFDDLGNAVASAGDFNGDGYADVIVGAPINDAGGVDAGRAYIYFGGPRADNVADVTFTGAAAGDEFGWSVAGIGDMNGDGFADVMVGAPFNDANGVSAGRAYVYFGGTIPNSGIDLTVTGVAAGDELGYSVAGIGDFNGDGFADVIVGAPFNDALGADAGRAFVLFGGTIPNSTADVLFNGVAAGDQFGYSLGAAGDVNADGYPDVIAGAPFNDVGGANAGQSYVFFGAAVPNTGADLTLTGSVAQDNFGGSVAGAGDVNGDGFADVVVGASNNDVGGASAGQAYVYFGAAIPNAVADLTLTGAAAGDQFGYSVAGTGDVNGDGFADVIVGAPLNSASGNSAGLATIYFGAVSPNSVADISLPGTLGGDEMGFAVAGAGDLNGDGFADVIVGAPLVNGGGFTDAGAAYATLIYPYLIESPNGGERWTAGKPATVRWSGHDLADIAVSLDGGATFSTIVAGVGGLAANEYTISAPLGTTEFAKVRLSQTGLTLRHSTSDLSDGVFRIAPPASPVAHRLARQFNGAVANDQAGGMFANAGDVNGDGFDDLILGVATNDQGGVNAGRAYLFFGGPTADNAPDLTMTGVAANDQLGFAVAGAGDVNGDGFDDFIVGANLNDAGGSNAGQAYVFFGGASPNNVADMTLTGTTALDNLGLAVAGAGDVNRDGFADVIVGAAFNDVAGADAGQAYVYFGGPSPDNLADLTLTGLVAGDEFGWSVAGVGDMNGDGFGDVMVGAPFNDAAGSNAGQAYVYFGGASPNNVADLTLTAVEANDNLGWCVAGAGDVNGDGFADAVVGAPLYGPSASLIGQAYVYFGSSNPDAAADFVLTGEAIGDEFGFSAAGAGDVNGDGFDDLIVGAPFNDTGLASTGRAYVYFGGATLDGAVDFTTTGPAFSDQLGKFVAGGGDVNGDGFADVIVGVPFNDAAATNAGAAQLIDFNRCFVTSPNGGETWNVGATQSVSWLGATPADLWLSTDGGGSYDLLETNVGGAEVNTKSVRVPHAPTRFARIKVMPSDAAVLGRDQSDSLFTIQTSVSLLTLSAHLAPEGGALLSWSTDPGVGADGLAGYRVYRLDAGSGAPGTRIGPDLIAENLYRDAAGTAGSRYRVAAVNGLGEELSLGEVALAPAAPLAAWPLPYRGGAMQISFATVGGYGGGADQAFVGIFDVAGRQVRDVARGAFRADYQSAAWDGRDDSGRDVGNGVYFLIARSGGKTARVKLVVMR